jgi:hypothetical protein
MRCIICANIGNPTPTYICAGCQKDIDKTNERVEMMYLLKEAYKHVSAIWLMERIERLFELKGKKL